MTRAELLAIAWLVDGVVGCHAQPPPSLPLGDTWVEIADAGYARAHSNVTKHTALPFQFLPEGVSGTQLVVQFLDAAERRGARYASNLAIVLQLQHGGDAVECVTRIVPEGNPQAVAAATARASDERLDDTTGTTTIRPWRPNLVTAPVDDHAYACERVAERVEVLEPEPENFFMAEAKFIVATEKAPTPNDNVVTADWRERCRLEKQHHQVTRYEHFVAAHFQPPDWETLGKAFATTKLVELPPECHAIAKATRRLQRIEADLGYSGDKPQLRRKPMYVKPKYLGNSLP